jgi:WhiB family redox-sensing transcriptional regulator
MKFPNLTAGLCREIGTEPFFPDGPGEAESLYRLARTICSGCGVRNECLEWAIRHEDHGMWGGTTPVERRMIRRKRKIHIQEIYVKDYV